MDLVKLATKELFVIPSFLTSFVPTLIAIFFVNQVLFVQNFIFAPSAFFFSNLDGLIFYHLILVMLSNIVLLLIGFLSQSKYSLMGVFRAVVHVVSMDIYITITYVLLVFFSFSGNFHDYTLTQYQAPFIFLLMPAGFMFFIIMLLESKRAPFDHVETEAEVVAGYATEYGGLYLLTFYLVEYFHLIIAANHFVIVFVGGWSLLNPKALIFFLTNVS